MAEFKIVELTDEQRAERSLKDASLEELFGELQRRYGNFIVALRRSDETVGRLMAFKDKATHDET